MNNNRKPIALKDLDVSKIAITKPKKHEFGLMSYINYGDGPLRLLLPAMKIPWAAGESKFDTGSPKKIEVALSFEGKESNPELDEAYTKLQEIDRRMVELILENRNDLYPKEVNKNVNPDEVAKRYQPMAGPPTESNGVMYAPKLKLRIEREREDPSKLVTLKDKPLLKDNSGNPVQVNADNVSQVLGKGTRIQPVTDAKFLFIASRMATVRWSFRMGKLTSSDNEEDWDLEPDTHETQDSMLPTYQPQPYREDEGDVEEVLDDDEELVAAMG